jgi:thiosulfate/3-mercaptopyruvate sulfurtransferase
MVINSLNKKSIIDPIKLAKIINSNQLKIIDCRWYLKDVELGKRDYKKNHIPNAIFFDIEKIANKSSSLPHMLPTKKLFLKFIEDHGITKKDFIVLYDQVGFFCSTRVWFLFFLFGFKKLMILNGGFKYWVEKKLPLKNTFYKKIKKKNDIKKNTKFLANKEYIKKKIGNNNTVIIDARPRERFLGYVNEPRKNLKRGNIEGSINIPYTQIVNKKGQLLSESKLRKLFKKKIDFEKTSEIICSCGSGITACNILFSLNLIGFKNFKLYDGSWAEWGKN